MFISCWDLKTLNTTPVGMTGAGVFTLTMKRGFLKRRKNVLIDPLIPRGRYLPGFFQSPGSRDPGFLSHDPARYCCYSLNPAKTPVIDSCVVRRLDSEGVLADPEDPRTMIVAMFCAIWYGADRPMQRRRFLKENIVFQKPGPFFSTCRKKRGKTCLGLTLIPSAPAFGICPGRTGLPGDFSVTLSSGALRE